MGLTRRLIFLAFCFLGTARHLSCKLTVSQHFKPLVMNHTCESATQHFSQLLQFITTSDPLEPLHVRLPQEFERMDGYLKAAYYSVWSQLRVEKVGKGELSYLLTWEGRDASLDPVLYVSHIDVVPVTEETLQEWERPPFSGAVADGFVWGRGAIDVKVGVAGLLEAASQLLEEGFTPERTVLFAFGQDEEVGGDYGAGMMAELLKQRGVSLDVIVDEGSSVIQDGFPPFTHQPIALIGTAEKGYSSWQVNISGTGGHSSVPPIDGSSVAGVIGRMLTALEVHPPSPRLVSPVTELLKGLAPFAPEDLQELLAHCDEPVHARHVADLLAALNPDTAALVRTTATATHISAGVADNVLPQLGTIGVNLRLLSGWEHGDALAHLEKMLGPDQGRASITPMEGNALPSQVTNSSGRHFQALRRALEETWSFAGKPPLVLPMQQSGSSDSKHYAELSRGGILRHVPISLVRADGDLDRIHGTNERCRVSDFCLAIQTYKRLIQLLNGKPEQQERHPDIVVAK